MVPLQFSGYVIDMLDVLCPVENRIKSQFPLTYEQIHFPYGFVLYEAKLTVSGVNLTVAEPHDRGYVTLGRGYVGTLIRDNTTTLKVNAKVGQTLRILIENMGRKDNGENDYKGLVSNVTIDGSVVTGWTIYPLDFESVSKSLLLRRPSAKSTKTLAVNVSEQFDSQNVTKAISYQPSIYYGSFAAPVISDSYFDTTGWGKGQLFINGFNVGRYWPNLGPQVTLYVPKSFLRLSNTVMLVEVEQPGNCLDEGKFFCEGTFTDVPYLNKPIKGETKLRATYPVYN